MKCPHCQKEIITRKLMHLKARQIAKDFLEGNLSEELYLQRTAALENEYQLFEKQFHAELKQF